MKVGVADKELCSEATLSCLLDTIYSFEGIIQFQSNISALPTATEIIPERYLQNFQCGQ